MVVGTPVRPDDVAMARRLREAGVPTELRTYPKAPQGFTRHPTPLGRAAREDLESWLAARLSGR